MAITEKFQALSEAILDGDEDLALEETDKLLADGVKPIDIFTDCVEPTLNHLGDQFSRLEVFLPDLIIAGDVVKEMQDKLLPIMEAEQSETSTKGTGVICTVYGDLHDIGKNMVALMLQINGYDVIDLGEDVSPLTVVKKAEEIKADLVCLSGLMLPSLPYMDETIQQVRASSILKDTKVMVGGGPVTQEWADKHGADGYSDDAMGAVRLAGQLLGK